MLKAIGIGRLTADPVLKTINVAGKDVSVVNFSVAVNEYRGRGNDKTKEAHFFDCEAWDSGAEVIDKWCNKGDQIYIEGKLREQRWEKDGNTRRKVMIRVEQFELLGRRQLVNPDESASDDVQDDVPVETADVDDNNPPF